MRKHRTLRQIWYMQTDKENIEEQVRRKDPNRFENVYKHLFSVDFVSDRNEFLLEQPFTFINWR